MGDHGARRGQETEPGALAGAPASCSATRPITGLSTPLSGSNANSDFAICGCTLSMSIRKLSAPRLSARRSNAGACGPVSLASAEISVSMSSRMRTTACDAWSWPSTDSTPRIDDS